MGPLTRAAVCVLLPALGMTHNGSSATSRALTGSPARSFFAPSSPTSPSALSCGSGKDLVVRALEGLRADSTQSQLIDADEFLKRATDLCSELGEAWYFRSIVEAKLGHTSVAAYAKRQAAVFSSDAQTDGINPFVLSSPPVPNAPLPTIQRRWALIIGIGAFSDSSIHPLQYSLDDATTFRDTLVDAKIGGFLPANVRLLTNKDATLRSIKEGLNWLARSAAPDDLVVVYIASHGSSREVDTAGANYIITHDTEIGEKVNPDALYATALPMVELANAVATRLKSRRTAVFIDTCYSGGAASSDAKLLAPGVATASVSQSTLDHISQGAGRIIFAASKTDQESFESDQLQHGYFTYFLVKALREHPGVPLSRIFASVQQGVSTQVETDLRLYKLHQTPVMTRSAADTDFSLGPAPTTAVAKLEPR